MTVNLAPARAVRPAVRPTPQPDPEPEDLGSYLAAPNGAELVIEMAHDLRSPLTSILFLSESLQRGETGPVNDAQRRSLALMRSAALALCATASDVVELARGGCRLADQAEAFSLSEVLLSVRDMILPLAEEKGIEVHLVHAVPERRVGYGRALSRALLNLATNAAKYTDAGFVEIAVQPQLHAPTRLRFSVRDTGAGIDPETVRCLYQPFRTPSADVRHRFSSTGLGLAICRKLVRAMGGELELETAPGRGTTFFFTLDLPPATAGS